MLAPGKVEEVRRLLALGNLSQRQIARQLRVARGAVSCIAAGKRPDYPVRQPEEPELLLPPVRCPGCGGMVIHRAGRAVCEIFGLVNSH